MVRREQKDGIVSELDPEISEDFDSWCTDWCQKNNIEPNGKGLVRLSSGEISISGAAAAVLKHGPKSARTIVISEYAILHDSPPAQDVDSLVKMLLSRKKPKQKQLKAAIAQLFRRRRRVSLLRALAWSAVVLAASLAAWLIGSLVLKFV